MKVLVINQFGDNKIVTTDFIPRTGDKVDVFYEPMPSVISVVAWPSKGRLKAVQADGFSDRIEAIVVVDN